MILKREIEMKLSKTQERVLRNISTPVDADGMLALFCHKATVKALKSRKLIEGRGYLKITYNGMMWLKSADFTL